MFFRKNVNSSGAKLSIDELALCRDIIKKHPIFNSLSDNELVELSSYFTRIDYKKNEVIVEEDSLINGVYFLINGQAEVVHRNKAKNESLAVGVIYAHQPIGLSSQGLYSTTGKRTATVNSMSNLSVIYIKLEDLIKFFDNTQRLKNLVKDSHEDLSRIEFIKQAAPFANLKFEKLYWISKQLQEISITAGNFLFKQNDEPTACYFLIFVEVEVSILLDNAEKKILANLSAPNLIGETAVIYDIKRNATIKVTKDAKFLVMPKDLLQNIVQTEAVSLEIINDLISLRLRYEQIDGIQIHHKEHEGEEITLLVNNSGDFYRLSKEGYFIWQKLDGQNSLRDITLELFQKYQIFNPQMVTSLVNNLTIHHNYHLNYMYIFFLWDNIIMEKDYH